MTALTPGDRALLDAARTVTLATIDPDGVPRLVPICFVVVADDGDDPVLWSPLDEKPKRPGDPRSLARVRDILVRPDVRLLVDHWSEDWSELAWLRLRGVARLMEPASVPAGVVAALRERYPQYADHDLVGRPMLAITVDHVSGWRSSPTS